MEQSALIETLLGTAAFVLLISFGIFLAFRFSRKKEDDIPSPSHSVNRRTPRRSQAYRMQDRAVRQSS